MLEQIIRYGATINRSIRTNVDIRNRVAGNQDKNSRCHRLSHVFRNEEIRNKEENRNHQGNRALNKHFENLTTIKHIFIPIRSLIDRILNRSSSFQEIRLMNYRMNEPIWLDFLQSSPTIEPHEYRLNLHRTRMRHIILLLFLLLRFVPST